MGKRLRFLTDVDEVLGDFQIPALRIMERITGRRYTPESFTEWDMFSLVSDEEKRAVFAEIEKPGWCQNVQPLPGAIDFIKEVRKHCDVFVVTSPFHSNTWVAERYAWLAKHFDFKSSEVVHTSAKHLVVGDVFLDDNPSNIDKWCAAHPGKLGMLWHIPNTRLMPYDHVRVRSWEEALKRTLDFQERPSVYDLLRKAEWHVQEDRDGVSYNCFECGGSAFAAMHKPGCQVDAILNAVYGPARRLP